MKDFQGNELAKKILELVKPYTCFPAILLETQAKKMGIDLAQLQKNELAKLAESIEKAVAAFGNPAKGKAAKEKIIQLI